MERMIAVPRRLVGDTVWLLRWLSMRFMRTMGPGGLAAVLAVSLFVVLLIAARRLEERRLVIDQQLAQAQAIKANAAPSAKPVSGLANFRHILTPHEEIPQVLADLFELAAQRQLVLVRGEYRTQTDDAGGFVRYRMSFPVKGQAASIQSFIEDSLMQHRSLAFDSIQFKREKIEAAQVEARIQWTLFTQLPLAADPLVRKAP